MGKKAITCKVFQEKFFERGGEKWAKVTIRVDFVIPVTENYLSTTVKSNDSFLSGTCRCNQHNVIPDTHPFSAIKAWRSKKGETFLGWLRSLVDEGSLTPKSRDRNGGLSDYEAVKKERKKEIRYR